MADTKFSLEYKIRSQFDLLNITLLIKLSQVSGYIKKIF